MKKSLLLSLLLLSVITIRLAAKEYVVDARGAQKPLRSSHLKMGGSNLLGESIEINNYYLSIDKKPAIPVTGEFHFSRYPNQYWEEAIQKMKAGGISMIATYVFWNMHEELEGQFNWTGDNNLRKFIELCAARQMKVILRIGPFCHGEIRNGGLPDWLLGRALTIRSNDPAYLAYVDRLYRQIGRQVNGLLFRDGGPIIAIQLENEYQHSAAPWGLTYPGQPHDFTASEQDRAQTQEGVGISQQTNPYAELGNRHMSVLKSLAQKNGLIAPLYTATGWGNAAVIENETLPVTAAYPYPGWAPAALSDFYLYSHLQKKPDYSPVRYKPDDYPYFAAEIGGGIMGTYTRRPVIPAKSMDALINRFLGSGANGVGYYMYHGGSTPKGKQFFFSDEAYGYPKISYDFQAPLSEYGKPVASFHRLKLLHYFLNRFGEILAPMQVVLPENADLIKAGDKDLRFAVRTNGKSGFLFMNNFQDHQEREDISDIRFTLKLEDQELFIPETGGFTLKKEENAILPVNLQLDNIQLNYATAQLLTSGKDAKGEFFLFFAPEGIQPEFSIRKRKGQSVQGLHCQITQNNSRWLIKALDNSGSEITVKEGNKETRILVFDKQTALTCWIVKNGAYDQLIITEAVPLQNRETVELISTDNARIDCKFYPALSKAPKMDTGTLTEQKENSGIYSHFHISLQAQSVPYKATRVGNKLAVDISSGMPTGVKDIICRINYQGDTGQAFLNGELIADNFYNGIPWNIGLKKFLEKPEAKELVFYFRPMYKEAECLQDLPPHLLPAFNEQGQFLTIGNPEFSIEYSVKLAF